jgi:flagellar biosynthesis component FlhA
MSPGGPRVTLEVTPPLMAVIEATGRRAVEAQLRQRLESKLAWFGVPGELEAELVARDRPRAMGVLVDGRPEPYPPSFLQRLWLRLAPRDLRAAADEATASDPCGFPDRWIPALAEQTRGDEERGGRDALVELALELAVEAVSLRPSSLLTPAAAAEFLGDGAAGPSAAVDILGGLLDLGVTLRDREAVRTIVSACLAAGRSDADTLEEAFSRLRAQRIEVHVDRRRLAELGDGLGSAEDGVSLDDPRVDDVFAQALAAVREHRLQALGVRLPIVFIRSSDVDPFEIRIKLNDRTGPPIPIPGSDEIGVSAPPAVLRQAGIAARPLIDPVTGHELSAVEASAADAVQGAGFVPVPHTAYIAACFARGVTPLAYRLVSIDEVEADLAALEHAFPSLVHSVLARYGLGATTRLVRNLVREQVSVRDLWRILNAMLGHGVAATEAPPQERLPAGEERALLAHVRAELRDRVSHDSGALPEVGPHGMAVYETDQGFEALLGRLPDAPLDDGDVTAIRDSVWRALGADPPSEPVLLTAAAVRERLRQAIERELPSARVLARSEIPPGARVERLAAIAVA